MQAQLTNRDLTRVRLRFLDLLKSFFQDEPDAERLSRWRGIFAALEKERITRQLDTTIQQLAETLSHKSLQQIQDEYYKLFTDPYSKQLLPLTATHYMDGKSYGPSLAALREILKQGQVVKKDGIIDPEDSLPLMLDAMISLIQDEAKGALQTRHLQEQLLQKFLVPTGKQIHGRISSIPEVDFFRSCIAFLNAYLGLEQGLLDEETLG